MDNKLSHIVNALEHTLLEAVNRDIVRGLWIYPGQHPTLHLVKLLFGEFLFFEDDSTGGWTLKDRFQKVRHRDLLRREEASQPCSHLVASESSFVFAKDLGSKRYE